jgi:hypothetical protein
MIDYDEFLLFVIMIATTFLIILYSYQLIFMNGKRRIWLYLIPWTTWTTF